MNHLDALQRRFQDFVLRGDTAIGEHVVGNAQASAARRLDIYARAYRLRLLECLADNFPNLQNAAGSEDFDALGRAYIDAHPSANPSVRWYGHRLPGFLATNAPWREQPWLAELAAFEWALRGAFDAGDGTPLPVEALAQLPAQAWPGLRFDFQPSVQRLDLRWNATAAWKALDAGQTPDPATESAVPVPWVIWRRELQPWFRSLEVDEAFAMDALLGGAGFADVCEGICEWVDAANAPMRMAGLLKTWISEGMLRGLHVGHDDTPGANAREERTC